jgi:hypothetical protein
VEAEQQVVPVNFAAAILFIYLFIFCNLAQNSPPSQKAKMKRSWQMSFVGTLANSA